jgi:hypothetical protein
MAVFRPFQRLSIGMGVSSIGVGISAISAISAIT